MATTDSKASHEPVLGDVAASREAILAGEHADPHAILGPHAARIDGVDGVVVRAYHPYATTVRLVDEAGEEVLMPAIDERGLFAVFLPGAEAKLRYRLRLRFADGSVWERDDPYRFPPTQQDFDLYLFGEGTHQKLWECLGARPATIDGVDGYAFSVWAPNACRVSVVGPFCGWDGRVFPMRRLATSGIFDLFVPGLADGELYKFEILTAEGSHLKADPLARWAEVAPSTASRTFRSRYEWGDGEWMEARQKRDPTRLPMTTYEVHLGSWKRDGDRLLSYRELAEQLVDHVKELGFNYLQLLPVAEHPFSGSWGYQVTGYFAPTARHGDPDDFRYFVDHCHRNGIGVILDWVPGHFVKDAHGLGRFDGSALYEHADPRQGVHPDWDTYVFNHGRFEVRSFLVSNALFWLEELHLDGLRVDAVASMLYLDYSREEGEWILNRHGGKENLEAVELLQQVNRVVHERAPGCFTVAEESTAWSGVTATPEDGGLGFDLKWNMGWMHDSLAYFATDPLFRSGCHDQLTFAMIYEYSERFVNPLSHDEVVHGKGSLLGRMPGDMWRKLASLRTLLAYQYTRPGKILLFMGSELAPSREWNDQTGLDWYLKDDPDRSPFYRFVGELGRLYKEHACLWRSDPDPEGFQWITCHDRENSVVAYERRLTTPGASTGPGESEHLVVVLNLTPVPREGYRMGAPRAGRYKAILSSDDPRFGGSGFAASTDIATNDEPWDGYRQSIALTLPPLAALVLAPAPTKKRRARKGVEADRKKRSRTGRGKANRP